MKMKNRWLPGLALSLFSLIAMMSAPSRGGAEDRDGGEAAHVRWDIIRVDFAKLTLSAGGQASAFANDQSSITLTGSGTFVAPAGDEDTSSAVTGGGTWHTFSPTGKPTGRGTYSVTGLVRWEPAPGTLPPGFIDLIGFAADTSPGLAVLRIAYSDGSAGVLVLSCTFDGTPPDVFEGVTASKGFVDYWNRQAENFTDFHLRHVQ
jgi:hypothetical protein